MAGLSKTSTFLILLTIFFQGAASINLPNGFSTFCPNIALNAPLTPNSNTTLNDVLQYPVLKFSGPSYLRPDKGGALFPWPYTVLWIVAHIPTVYIRLSTYDKMQLWSLAFAGLSVLLTVQAYISTGLQASGVLVWTPLPLIIDAGAMLQLLVLIIDKPKKLKTGTRSNRTSRWHAWFTRSETRVREVKTEDTDTEELDEHEWNMIQLLRKQALQESLKDTDIWKAAAALTMLLAIIALQIVAIIWSARQRTSQPPLVKWASPIFHPFGVAAITGDCTVYEIDSSSIQGVGSIEITGYRESDWLLGTLIGTSVALGLQIVDLILMLCCHSDESPGLKSRRPWCSFFAGFAMLISLLVIGIIYANNLPEGIPSNVWVVMDAAGSTRMYSGTLYSEGARGAIIGWTDGILSSWGSAYFGGSAAARNF